MKVPPASGPRDGCGPIARLWFAGPLAPLPRRIMDRGGPGFPSPFGVSHLWGMMPPTT